MTYMEELQTECTRTRTLCAEVSTVLMGFAMSMTDDKEAQIIVTELNRLLAASRGDPFTLNSEKE